MSIRRSRMIRLRLPAGEQREYGLLLALVVFSFLSGLPALATTTARLWNDLATRVTIAR